MELRLRHFAGRRVQIGWLGASALAVFCVGLATLARIGFGLVFGPTLPFATYFPAIMVAALFGGAFAGILTIPLSVLVVWWAFTPPYYEWAPLTLLNWQTLSYSRSRPVSLFGWPLCIERC